MKLYHPPSGLAQGLDLLIAADWSPDQALAVIELLDDLRDRIWTHYEVALIEKLRDERLTHFDTPRPIRRSDRQPRIASTGALIAPLSPPNSAANICRQIWALPCSR